MSEELPEKLYHYTNATATLGIATSKALWATSIRYLNDSTEYLHALHLVRLAVEAREGTLSEKELAALSYLLDGFHSITNDWRGVGYYVVSLSSKPDLLSQWRAYAPRGGYSIGFSSAYLRERATANGFRLQQCIYDKERQERLAEAMLDVTLGNVRAQAPEIDFTRLPYQAVNEQEAVELQKLITLQGEFEASLGRIASICKNPAFSEESEWRLVATGFDPGREQFRDGRALIVPYIEFALQLSTGTANAGAHVICGPSADTALSQYSALRLFSAKGWPSVTVERSMVPYREW